MSEQVKNVALDRRANSFLLKPPKKQTNNWGKGFQCSKPNTDMDNIDKERCMRIADYNRSIKK